MGVLCGCIVLCVRVLCVLCVYVCVRGDPPPPDPPPPDPPPLDPSFRWTPVPMGSPGLAQNDPRESLNAHFVWSSALNRAHNFTRRPQEREESLGEGKKARNFGPPTLRPPPFRPSTRWASTVSGFGPRWAPKIRAPPRLLGPPLFLGLGTHSSVLPPFGCPQLAPPSGPPPFAPLHAHTPTTHAHNTRTQHTHITHTVVYYVLCLVNGVWFELCVLFVRIVLLWCRAVVLWCCGVVVN